MSSQGAFESLLQEELNKLWHEIDQAESSIQDSPPAHTWDWPSRYSEDSIPAPGEEDINLGIGEHPSLHKMNIEVFPSSEKQSPSAIHVPASEMFAQQPEESFDFSVDYD